MRTLSARLETDLPTLGDFLLERADGVLTLGDFLRTLEDKVRTLLFRVLERHYRACSRRSPPRLLPWQVHRRPCAARDGLEGEGPPADPLHDLLHVRHPELAAVRGGTTSLNVNTMDGTYEPATGSGWATRTLSDMPQEQRCDVREARAFQPKCAVGVCDSSGLCVPARTTLPQVTLFP